MVKLAVTHTERSRERLAVGHNQTFIAPGLTFGLKASASYHGLQGKTSVHLQGSMSRAHYLIKVILTLREPLRYNSRSVINTSKLF